jgi:outer membrane protein TolC
MNTPTCLLKNSPAVRTVLFAAMMVITSAKTFGQSVDSLIREAYRNNPQLQSLTHQADAAGYRASAAGALPAPSFGVEFSQVPTNSANVLNDAISDNITLSQMFMLGGKLSAMSDVEKRKGTMLEHTRASLLVKLRAAVKLNYVQLWLLDRQIEIRRSTIRLLDELAASLQSRVQTNRLRSADLLTVQAEAASERARLAELMSKRTGIQNVLISLTAPQTARNDARSPMKMDETPKSMPMKNDERAAPAVQPGAAPDGRASAPAAQPGAAPDGRASASAVQPGVAPDARASAPAVQPGVAPDERASAPAVQPSAARDMRASAPAVQPGVAPDERASAPMFRSGYTITPDSILPALPASISERELSDLLLESNPALLSMDHMKEVNELEIRAARKELIPDLMVQAMIMRMPNGMVLTGGPRSSEAIRQSVDGMAMKSTEWMYSIMASVTLPFVPWSSERSTAKADEMRSMNMSVDADKNAMEREMLSTLGSAVNAFQTQDSLGRQYRSVILPLTHDAAQAQTVAYQTGQATLPAVLDAYRMELMKTDDYLMTVMNQQMAFIDMEMMVGVPLQ